MSTQSLIQNLERIKYAPGEIPNWATENQWIDEVIAIVRQDRTPDGSLNEIPVLLPCPFCSEAPRLIHWNDWKDRPTGQVSITCDNENCFVEAGTGMRGSQAEAIAAWNTRGEAQFIWSQRPTPEPVPVKMIAATCVCGRQMELSGNIRLQSEIRAIDGSEENLHGALWQAFRAAGWPAKLSCGELADIAEKAALPFTKPRIREDAPTGNDGELFGTTVRGEAASKFPTSSATATQQPDLSKKPEKGDTSKEAAKESADSFIRQPDACIAVNAEAIKAAGRCIHSWNSNLGDRAAEDVVRAYLAALPKSSVSLKALYKNIGHFVNRWKRMPRDDSPETLDVISDFMLCMGAELGFRLQEREGQQPDACRKAFEKWVADTFEISPKQYEDDDVEAFVKYRWRTWRAAWNARPERESGWQSIERAPKDGSRVLCWKEGWDNPVYLSWVEQWSGRTSQWLWADLSGDSKQDQPTHWLDTLPPPEQSRRGPDHDE